MIGWVGKLLFAGLCLLGTLSYAKALVAYTQFYMETPNIFVSFGAGAMVYTILWVFVFSQREKFWSVVEHELTHVLFALLFFKRVHSFTAHRTNGGSVEIEGDNFMIALSPYFFPLLSVMIVLIKPSVFSQYQWILNGLLGFTLMFHLVHLVREFHPSQPDLKKYGLLFSFLVVLFFNVFFIGLCIASLQGDWGPMKGYLEMGFREGLAYVIGGWKVFYQTTLAGLF